MEQLTKNIEEIKIIYKNYGFEVRVEEPDIHIFLYKKGRYFGVDIIPLIETQHCLGRINEIKTSYSALGYAVNIKSASCSKEIENELFKSFFSYKTTISRLKRKCDDFYNKQTKNLLGNQYQYIESPFDLYDGEFEYENNGLLNIVDDILSRNTPQLVIIEAAAGYGKTCAAYEILKNTINQKNKLISPLFTELSKNRGAKIFRYILLDEIDNEFSSLSSELVIHEIKNGRIPLIIDGFDELLDKVNISNVDTSNIFDEIESMLDTIGNLLERNAKVILTTRKTAVFSGLEFDKWYEKWNKKFEVSRFSIKEPRIIDWLGGERLNEIKDKNIPIQYIANPVILAYLKNIEVDDFQNQIENSEILIRQYFNKMLERERERQNLIISVDKQYEIFKNVAKMLLDFDITVESKEFFKEIIKEQNSKLLEYTRSLYTGQEKPTLENLVDTLATHALLDRKGRHESQIGFVNDFVLGIFAGEIIRETHIDQINKNYSYYMLDLACTAYKVQNNKNKSSLWEKINGVLHKLQPISIFQYDIMLKDSLMRDYYELSIYDSSYYNIEFKEYKVEQTAFLNCNFTKCTFDTAIFAGVSFINCVFNKCTVINDEFLDFSKNVSTIKCKLIECEILEHYEYHENEKESVFNDIESEILKNLFSISGTKSQHIIQLLHCFDKKQQKNIMRTVSLLEKRDFIKIRGSHINFNINKLGIIKTELGL